MAAMWLADQTKVADGAPAAASRCLLQTAILHHERYRVGDEPAQRRAYDQELRAFSGRSERTAYTWTDRVFARVGRVAMLNGRDKLVDQLRRLGFPLR